MAFSEVVGHVFGVELLDKFYQENLWAGLARDRSSELAFGDTLEIPVDNTSYSLTDVSSTNIVDAANASALAWGTPSLLTPSKVDLVINVYQQFNYILSTRQSAEIRFNYMQRATSELARLLTEALNGNIRSKFDALTGTGNVVTTVSTKASEWGDATHLNALEAGLRAAKVQCDGLHWPRGRRLAVMGPALYDLMGEMIKEKNLYLVPTTATTDAAVGGTVSGWESWQFVMDDSIATARTANDDANHSIYFMLRGEGISFAQRLRNVQVIPNSEVYTGALIRGQILYGSAVEDDTKLKLLKSSITTG